MKAGAIVRIILWGLVTAVLCAVLAGGLIYDGFDFPQISLGTDGYRFSDVGTYSVGDITLDSNTVHSLDIEWVAGSIRIKKSDGDKLVVRESKLGHPDNELRWRIHNGQLQIRYCKPRIFGLGSLSKDLEILLPADMLLDGVDLRTIAIENVSSRIEIRDIAAQAIEIESVSGNIHLINSDVGMLEMENVSGTVQVLNCTLDKIETSTVSGNVSAEGTIRQVELEGVSARLDVISAVCPREITCKTVSGSLHLTIPENAGFVLSLDSLSGNLYAPEFSLTSHGSGKYICGDGTSFFEIESISGQVDIQKNVPAND